jgi:SAM-dependent methyltransferase
MVHPSSYPERILPDETEAGVVAIHLKRYEFARQFCVEKDVLDAACGVGYGTAHLARSARFVLGIDIDPESIDYARRRYGGNGIAFACKDVLGLDLPPRSFDTICTFETLEHLDDPERGIVELSRVLRDAGTLILSTPKVDETNLKPANPHHRVELSVADLEGLLNARFVKVQLFGQRRTQTRRHRLMQRVDIFGVRRRLRPLRSTSRLLGTPATPDVTLDDVVIDARLSGASEIVAVCTNPRR